jgi:hypothetical protein
MEPCVAPGDQCHALRARDWEAEESLDDLKGEGRISKTAEEESS